MIHGAACLNQPNRRPRGLLPRDSSTNQNTPPGLSSTHGLGRRTGQSPMIPAISGASTTVSLLAGAQPPANCHSRVGAGVGGYAPSTCLFAKPVCRHPHDTTHPTDLMARGNSARRNITSLTSTGSPGAVPTRAARYASRPSIHVESAHHGTTHVSHDSRIY